MRPDPGVDGRFRLSAADQALIEPDDARRVVIVITILIGSGMLVIIFGMRFIMFWYPF